MNELQVFDNPEFGEIRTIEENGKILFCGTDVARALGYAKPEGAVQRHCRYPLKRGVPHPQAPNKLIEMLFIPEGDVYRLIAHSKLPAAEKFESWLFDEVVPAIAKHGAYMTPAKIEEALLDPDTIIRLATTLKEEREKNRALNQTVSIQQQQIAELQPKASYYDLILNCKDAIAISVIAKDYGWSANRMNKYLHELGIQYKQDPIWLLYQKYAEQGYTVTKTFPVPGSDGVIRSRMYTYWTQKGRLFIYEMLKANGYLPLIERENIA